MQLGAFREAAEDFADALAKAEARGEAAMAEQARAFGELAAGQL